MNHYTESYSENPLFVGLSEVEIEEVLLVTKSLRYQKGEIIFSEGDIGKSLYLMEEGSVEISKIFDDEPYIIARLNARTIFGEMALTSEDPRSASVVCLEAVHVYELSAHDFNNMLQNHSVAVSKITINIARILSGRMNHLNKLVADNRQPVLAKTDLNTFKHQIFSDWSF